MALTIKPLSYIDINHFSQADRLEIVQGNGLNFYFQLWDDVANQRYVPQAGSTVQVTFPRAPSVAAVPQSQDVTVTGVIVDSRDVSLYKAVISATQTANIISDGAKLLMTEGGVSTTWPVDHLVRKRTNLPGT